MTADTPRRGRGPVALLLARRDDASARELELLLAGLGIPVVRRLSQRRRGREPIGAGKRAEIAGVLAELEKEHGAGRVLLAVDDELSPGEHAHLANGIAAEVIDRTGVILRVFEQRARTPIAVLEVELARLTYQAPRIRDDEDLGDREGGGGRGGRGHSNVELAKMRIRDRIAELERKLAALGARQERGRSRRSGMLHVALVGYTNAGKSTWMRALTGSEVLVENRLFATLDATVRQLSPRAAPPVLISDTVGFIRHLPHELIRSFRSTLAEARDADLLLHVVDASDPEWRTQMRVTRESVATVGASEVPEQLLLNKVDRLESAERVRIAAEEPDALLVSALETADVARVREAILRALDGLLEEGTLELPFTAGRLLAEIRARARVVAEAATGAGLRLTVRALPEDLRSWSGAGRAKGARPGPIRAR